MNDEFISDVQMWGSLALAQDPFLDFDGLVRALPGVHPNDVANILGTASSISRSGSDQKVRPYVDSSTILPVPHPLDFDWRFSPSTVSSLSDLASSMMPIGGSAALLGTPSLFAGLRERRPDISIFLADKSTSTMRALKERYGADMFVDSNCDLLTDVLPEMSVDLAVADPPWYPEYFEAFMWAAGKVTRVEGSLLLCGPNIGTRPGAKREWAKIEEQANSLGFELKSLEPNLRYDSPPFESNAMRAAGHPIVSHDWRTGCLAVFERRQRKTVTRWVPNPAAADWCDIEVCGVRFRIRGKTEPSAINPALQELVIGNVLDSVSRRDVRRENVDVWTSGNRIFGCLDTPTLVLILNAVAAGASSATYVENSIGRKLDRAERDAVEASERHLRLIIRMEQNEYLRSAEEESSVS